jgi:hypothetical protein
VNYCKSSGFYPSCGLGRRGELHGEEYNQVYAWLQHVPWHRELFGMYYNDMMHVALHERTDEGAAAVEISLIMLRAQSAVQQDVDRWEVERVFQQQGVSISHEKVMGSVRRHTALQSRLHLYVSVLIITIG